MHIPQGVIAAMLTPFDENGNIAEGQVRKLVEFLIDKGVDGIFPVSSCGEYVHLDMEERKYLIDIVVDQARGRLDIIPGTGATCYKKSIELASYAKDKGCSAVVLHGPYFFKNIEEVVEGHVRKVAESVDIPIFLYNIPLFANEITPKIAESLASLTNIVGIKDSSGNMINVVNLIDMTRKIDPEFKVLVGVEEILYPALEVGGNGCMTASAGIIPEFMTAIYKNFNSGNKEIAKDMQFSILELIRVMKSINFPQGFKEALSIRGINMGPPKMEYNSTLLANIAYTKEKLEYIIDNLFKKYFPDLPIKYSKEVSYSPIAYNFSKDNITFYNTKKYEECTLCGMCEGDSRNLLRFDSNTKENQSKNTYNSSKNTNPIDSNNQITSDNYKKIVEDITKKILKEIK